MAPLKPLLEIVNELAEEAFPRLKERGSIEATQIRACMPTLCRFPRLKERGSIEADSEANIPLVLYHVSTFERTWLH